MKQHIIYSGIIILLALLLFRSECNKSITSGEKVKIDGKKYEVVKTEVDTVYVSAKPQIIYKKGKDIYRDTTIYKPLPIFDKSGLVDGELEKYYDSVLMSHFAINVFRDTIRFGNYGNVYITDSIQENAILSRMANSDLIFPSISQTTTVKELPKNELYLGAKSIIINNGMGAVGAGLMLKSKRDKLFGFGAMIDRQKNINFALDYYIKL